MKVSNTFKFFTDLTRTHSPLKGLRIDSYSESKREIFENITNTLCTGGIGTSRMGIKTIAKNKMNELKESLLALNVHQNGVSKYFISNTRSYVHAVLMIWLALGNNDRDKGASTIINEVNLMLQNNFSTEQNLKLPNLVDDINTRRYLVEYFSFINGEAGQLTAISDLNTTLQDYHERLNILYKPKMLTEGDFLAFKGEFTTTIENLIQKKTFPGQPKRYLVKQLVTNFTNDKLYLTPVDRSVPNTIGVYFRDLLVNAGILNLLIDEINSIEDTEVILAANMRYVFGIEDRAVIIRGGHSELW